MVYWLRLGVNVDDQLWLRLNPNPIPNPNPNRRHLEVNNELANNNKLPLLVVRYTALACWPMARLQHAVLLQVCKGVQVFSSIFGVNLATSIPETRDGSIYPDYRDISAIPI